LITFTGGLEKIKHFLDFVEHVLHLITFSGHKAASVAKPENNFSTNKIMAL
jgi:hypothetical protein